MLTNKPPTRARQATLAVLLGLAVLSGCGGKAFQHGDPEALDFRSRAETQVDGAISISAAVLGVDETRQLFGLDLYEQGIQPVWLKIENNGDRAARYAMVSTDPFYFSPLEVAYKNRGGYSDEARANMERHFDRLAMPRHVAPGEARDGFVFTHADRGAKGFNVDVFSAGRVHGFMFLLRVPGFSPDYANVDFNTIYAEDAFAVYHGDELARAIRELPCCGNDDRGEATSGAANVVLVGRGRDLLIALLRSRWVETSSSEAAEEDDVFMFGRRQDAIFRYESFDGDSLYELRLWLAPILHGDDRVWVGQVRHFFGFRRAIGLFDPDVDNARNFTLQNLIYGQSLEQLAWVAGEQVLPDESFWAGLRQVPFFTDGYRLVLWLTPDPLSMADIATLDWDSPTGMRR
jgi:hypothetical protein